MLRFEIKYFLTSLMFFTRLPCPQIADYQESFLQKSRKYFTLVGLVVGALIVLTLILAAKLLPISIATIISVIAGILITGAFHEDGFADVCDGFGGGWEKEQILNIMKDSRVGAYGAIGIFLMLILKTAVLIELGNANFHLMLATILCAHTISRYIASTFVHSHDYVQDAQRSKAKPIASERLSSGEMLFSFIFAVLPLFLLPHPAFALAFPVAYLAKFYLGRIFTKYIGGYTGDCLGAVQQLSEVIFYLAVMAIWKFI